MALLPSMALLITRKLAWHYLQDEEMNDTIFVTPFHCFKFLLFKEHAKSPLGHRWCAWDLNLQPQMVGTDDTTVLCHKGLRSTTVSIANKICLRFNYLLHIGTT